MILNHKRGCDSENYLHKKDVSILERASDMLTSIQKDVVSLTHVKKDFF